MAFRTQLADAAAEPQRLAGFVGNGDDAERAADFVFGEEIFIEPEGILVDEFIGGVDDALGRAVILFEADDSGIREVKFMIFV